MNGPHAPLAIVTATTNLERARPCIESWIVQRASREVLIPIFVLLNGCARPDTVEIAGMPVAWIHTPDYLGTVPAFRRVMDGALHGDYDVIACFHDDFTILEAGWDAKVLKYFERLPQLGLAGFGGASGLGASDMYEKFYDPMSLARIGFRSDLVDAEVHGFRSVLAERVACLDGFSQIGRREFWEGQAFKSPFTELRQLAGPALRPWTVLEDLGLVHHLYDGLLGCLAARYGWETWYIPLRSRHDGGQTAVGDPGYQAWAAQQTPGGDEAFWQQAHQIGYEAFRDVLPIRVL